MKDKVCLITGATAGIGKAAAAGLADLGATVVLVGRDTEKTSATAEQIQGLTGNQEVSFLLADLSSQQSVRQLAEDFRAGFERLDVLVNNAGALMLSRQESSDGIEMTFALNHLSYFLLTNLLLDVIKSSSPSRIVNVASDAHQGAHLDFDDLQSQNSYGGYKAYGRSKLANLLFTYELARKLKGTGVTANGLHPGVVATSFMATNNGLRGRLYNFFLKRVGRRVEDGARTVVYLATSPEVEGVSGGYFMDEGLVDSSEASYDKEASLRLWEESEALTGLESSGEE